MYFTWNKALWRGKYRLANRLKRVKTSKIPDSIFLVDNKKHIDTRRHVGGLWRPTVAVALNKTVKVLLVTTR